MKNKKFLAWILALFTAFSFSACDFMADEPASDSVDGGSSSVTDTPEPNPDPEPTPTPNPNPDPDPTPTPDPDPTPDPVITGNVNHETYLKNGYSALFADPYYKKGISCVDASGAVSGNLVFPTSSGTPSWHFAQWASKYDIMDYNKRSYTNGGNTFTYESKGEKVNGNYVPGKILTVDSALGTVYMDLNAEVEYDAPRQDGEGWPHTLLSQDFGDNLIHVPELDELVMSIDYTITKFDDCMGSTAVASRHCAQLVWYVTLQNRNRSSEGYGQYVWFGLQLWDNRNSGKVVNQYAAEDAGKDDATHAFIFNPAGSYYHPEGKAPVVNQRRKIDFNILECAQLAFNTAKERGYLGETEWNDIYVGGMNFGFEVTGTYNIGAKIDAVGVYYK